MDKSKFAMTSIKRLGKKRLLAGGGLERQETDLYADEMRERLLENERKAAKKKERLLKSGSIPETESVVNRSDKLGIATPGDKSALIAAVDSSLDKPRALAALLRLTLERDFTAWKTSNAIDFLTAHGFDSAEFSRSISSFVEHRATMTRIIGKHKTPRLERVIEEGWKLSLIRYPKLRKPKLQITQIRQYVEEAIATARAQKNPELPKQEACRIVLHCLLLDLSDLHYNIPRKVEHDRYLARGLSTEGRQMEGYDERREKRIQEYNEEVASHERPEAHLEKSSKLPGGFKWKQFIQFTEHETDALKRKRRIEAAIMAHNRFKAILPNAAPCIDPVTEEEIDFAAKSKSDVELENTWFSAGYQQEAKVEKHAAPWKGSTQKLFELRSTGLDIDTYPEGIYDTFVGGNLRAVVGPTGDLKGLDCSTKYDNVLVFEPPIELSAEGFAIECWILLPIRNELDDIEIHCLCCDIIGDSPLAIAASSGEIGVFLNTSSELVCCHDPLVSSKEANIRKFNKGWRLLSVSISDTGDFCYFMDGDLFGLIQAEKLGTKVFETIESIGNSRDGYRNWGAFCGFSIFRTSLAEKQIKNRYEMFLTLQGQDPLGAGVDAVATKRNVRKRKPWSYEMSTHVDQIFGIGFFPAVSKEEASQESEATRALPLTLPQGAYKTTIYGLIDGQLEKRKPKDEEALLLTTGPIAVAQDTEFAVDTSNCSCVAVSPPIELKREFVQKLGWTLTCWIRLPLFKSKTAHVLIAGDYDYHVVVDVDQRSLGVCEGNSPSDIDSGMDSDDIYRTHNASGIDVHDFDDGWHLLTVVAQSGYQSFYMDGVVGGHIDYQSMDDIRFIGNSYTGQSAWGTFSEAKLFCKPFTSKEVYDDFQAYGFSLVLTAAGKLLGKGFHGAGLAVDNTARANRKKPSEVDSSSSSEKSDEGQMAQAVQPAAVMQSDGSPNWENHIQLNILSDGKYICIRPPLALRSHDIRAFGIEAYSMGPGGKLNAFDTVLPLKEQRAAGEPLDGGGLRIKPSVSLACGGWTIEAWIETPIPQTGFPHVLVGGKKGTSPLVVDTDCVTLGALCGDISELHHSRQVHSEYELFLPSNATLGGASPGWHHVVVTRDPQYFQQLFFVDGKYAGYVAAASDSSVSCFGNGRNKNGSGCRLPFGTFCTIAVYDATMPPNSIESRYKSQRNW